MDLFLFYFNFYFILLYNTVLVLPYIDMNPPQVYMSSQPWTPPPPPSPYHLSASSQCTSPKHPVSCIEPRLVIRFLHVLKLFYSSTMICLSMAFLFIYCCWEILGFSKSKNFSLSSVLETSKALFLPYSTFLNLFIWVAIY